jgi:hypothetical protein
MSVNDSLDDFSLEWSAWLSKRAVLLSHVVNAPEIRLLEGLS